MMYNVINWWDGGFKSEMVFTGSYQACVDYIYNNQLDGCDFTCGEEGADICALDGTVIKTF